MKRFRQKMKQFLPTSEPDKLRYGDVLLNYFLIPNGSTLWTLRRQDELFVHTLIGGNHQYFHCAWGAEVAHGVSVTMRLLGFREVPVYEVYGPGTKNDPAIVGLIAQFKIAKRENELKQKQEGEATNKQEAKDEA